MCSRVIKLIVDPSSSVGVAESLGTWMSNLELNLGKTDNIVCIYDVKLAGHASARGHLRTPPFRQAHFDRMIRGTLQAMSQWQGTEEIEMPDKTFFCCFDGGSHGRVGTPTFHFDFSLCGLIMFFKEIH